MADDFRLSLEELPDSAALESEKSAIQEELTRQGSRLAKLHWALVRDTACNGLRNCLEELNPVDCIAKGWSTAAEIRALAKETASSPGLEKELALASHKLSVAVHPLVTIHCDPIALPTLRFTLTVDAAVACAVLIIRDGKLAAIEAAKIIPSATLSYADSELKKLKLKPIDISRPYQFADGGLAIRT